ncbi:hypothetical protein GGI07_005243 [Coemansia sp. Benny D115]|nr:hypothetical protein GGI07_005243 [Coemansia sp. Benny D115]
MNTYATLLAIVAVAAATANAQVYWLGPCMLETEIDLGNLATRILVYLAAKHEKITWNYEIMDICAPQRTTAAQAKRKVGMRRQLTLEALEQFKEALAGHNRQTKHKPSTKRAALDTLRERIMCIETDVEWGDPALMRSPTRRGSMRVWADPTRLNESMSIRSYLYILGQAPHSLETLDAFIYGPSSEGNVPLMDSLTELRDSIVGNGIWESYSKKRVSVNWINPEKRPLAGMDPVEILIESVFGCCFESLGGSVLSAKELSAVGVPFSTVFAPFHRLRAFPSWSRKFSLDISAVVDAFSTKHAEHIVGATQTLLRWKVNEDGNPFSLVRVRADDRRQWLSDGRMVRSYDLPEMVALAQEYKQASVHMLDQTEQEDALLVPLCWASLDIWPQAVRMTRDEPICCIFEGGGRDDRFANSFMLAQQQSSSGRDECLYAVVVPAGDQSAFIYTIDSYARDCIVALSAEHSSSNVRETTEFDMGWIEDWAAKLPSALDVVPEDERIIDVSYKEPDDVQDTSSRLELSSTFVIHTADTSSRRGLMASVEAVSRTPDEIQSPAAPISVTNLHEWYAEVYLKFIARTSPDFSQAVDLLEAVVDGHDSDSSDKPNSDLDCIVEHILLTSTAVEDTFDLKRRQQDTSKRSGDDNSLPEDCYKDMRLQAIKAIERSFESNHHRWQLHECQLQMLLHLFVIDRLHAESKDEKAAEIERLADALRDLTDLLCVWVSMDDLEGISNAVVKPVKAAQEFEDCPGDLAAAFVGGPHVGRFASRLGDIIEDLRIQCGWVPQEMQGTEPVRPPNATGDPLNESKRRKGTPRKITKTSGDRSEVIVHQRQGTAKAASGRKLARHLEELIGNGSRAFRRGNSLTTNERPMADPLPPKNERRHSAQLKMPAHLIRQIKSEVVLAARPPLKSRSGSAVNVAGSNRDRSTGGGGGGGGSGSNIWSIGRSSSMRRLASYRPPVPAFQSEASSSSPTGDSGAKDVSVVPETLAKKRTRSGEHVPLTSSPAPVRLQQPSLSASSTFCYSQAASADRGMADSSPMLGAVEVSEMHSMFAHDMFDMSDDDSSIYIYDRRT